MSWLHRHGRAGRGVIQDQVAIGGPEQGPTTGLTSMTQHVGIPILSAVAASQGV